MSLDSTLEGTFRSHSPAQQWSNRMPSPPRIVIPPPSLASNGVPDLHLPLTPPTTSVHDFSTASGFANTSFLRTVTLNNFIRTNALFEWKYEHRRHAQAVLPFLYLGPSSAAKDAAFLRTEGITMVLAVRNTLSAQAHLLGSKPAQEMGLEVKSIDVAGNQELIAAFPQGIEAINTHLSQVYWLGQQGRGLVIGDQERQTGKVLVFCESGNERSASLVAAYIMAMYTRDLVQTLQVVQAQRFAVSFDDGLKNLLRTWGDILCARRMVLKAEEGEEVEVVVHTPAGTERVNGGMNGHVKRCRDEVGEDEEDVMEGVDVADESGAAVRREGVAPFQD